MIWINNKKEIESAIEKGKKSGHTHVRVWYEGSHDGYFPIEHKHVQQLINDPIIWRVYAIETGYPVYSNYNRHAYDPCVIGVTQKDNNSLLSGLAKFAST